jgi:hypothetical protein
LFITLSGQHALRNLRSIGFKTFDGIIDEHYDTIEPYEERFASALDQVEQLSQRDQSEVLEQVRGICQHNYSHMMRTPWYQVYFMPAFVGYFNQ